MSKFKTYYFKDGQWNERGKPHCGRKDVLKTSKESLVSRIFKAKIQQQIGHRICTCTSQETFFSQK